MVSISSISVHAQVEDYLQYTPMVAYLTLNVCNVPAKHELQERIMTFATSVISTYGITGGLKRIVSERRPDGSDCKSFPSGHAARSFMAANLLRHEFGHISPWITVAGYSCALATSALRVSGDHHYVHDVLGGAAIGLLSTEMSYYLLRLWQKRKNKEKEGDANEVQLVVMPSANTGELTMNGVIVF